MRRALVVTDESARHPFRMHLPPHVRLGDLAVPSRTSWRITMQDLKMFLMAYSACLLAVTTWIG